MKEKDMGLGIVSIALGITVFFASGSFPGVVKFFPRVVAIAVAILGALIFIDGLRTKMADGTKKPSESMQNVQPENGAEPSKSDEPKEAISYGRVALIAVLLFAYYFAIQYVGYLVSTFLLIGIGAYILCYKNYKVMLIVSATVTGSLYALFTQVFKIRFP